MPVLRSEPGLPVRQVWQQAQWPVLLQLVLLLIATTTLITFALHRIARAIPAVRRATPDWESWKRADFPFGLVLATTLWGYYALIVAITA